MRRAMYLVPSGKDMDFAPCHMASALGILITMHIPNHAGAHQSEPTTMMPLHFAYGHEGPRVGDWFGNSSPTVLSRPIATLHPSVSRYNEKRHDEIHYCPYVRNCVIPIIGMMT